MSIDALAALRADVAALRDRVARLEQGRRRGPIDPAAEVRLLSAIATAAAGRVFTCGELIAHASVDPDLAHAIGARSSRRLGKWLRSLNGRAVGGYRIVRIGRDQAGSLWTVQVVEHLHGGAGFSSSTDVE